MKQSLKKRGGASLVLGALLFFLLFLSVVAVCFFLFCRTSPQEEHTASLCGLPVVIIDAGHGGEDGGAVGVNGALEKDINLEIAFALQKRLCASGIECVMTREEDILLYDRNADYEGRKKLLDMQRRAEIASGYENAVFISIHQNSYPAEKYNGFQVYYSPNSQESERLALTLEYTVRERLQPYNKRASKNAGESIYLLKSLSCPAVLIECGFLSNEKECEALCTKEYRDRLCDILTDAVIEFISPAAES